jgi:hypothetical protein
MRSFSPEKNSGNIFLYLLRGGFTYSGFFILLTTKVNDVATCGSKRLYKQKLILDHLNAKFRSVYTVEHDVSLD